MNMLFFCFCRLLCDEGTALPSFAFFPTEVQEIRRQHTIHLKNCSCECQIIFLVFSAIDSIYCIQRGTPPAEAMEKNNNQPHIIMFSDEDEPINQYFVAVEQKLMMESSCITAAIFFTVAAHYIFNLSYHPKGGNSE